MYQLLYEGEAPPEPPSLPPGLSVHIRAASQRAAARMVADDFRQKSFFVPGIQILVESGPDETQVHYFHTADGAEAQMILDQLTASGVKNVAV